MTLQRGFHQSKHMLVRIWSSTRCFLCWSTLFLFFSSLKTRSSRHWPLWELGKYKRSFVLTSSVRSDMGKNNPWISRSFYFHPHAECLPRALLWEELLAAQADSRYFFSWGQGPGTGDLSAARGCHWNGRTGEEEYGQTEWEEENN